ncbi:MAG: hypothetical protein DRP35_00845 [Candidatus Zixiibacteriota bacterium]|nr:MAG: hypothetical protein DRP35_00845 [candidate division Zixibacteria bacterium]
MIKNGKSKKQLIEEIEELQKQVLELNKKLTEEQKSETTKHNQTEEDLWSSETKLKNLFENSNDTIYSHTPEHVLTYLSPQVLDMLGYTQEEALIKWTELTSDNPINEIGFEHTVKAIKTGKRQPPYELELVKKNGEKIWIRVREFPYVEDGNTTAIIGSLTNITEQKKTEEALLKSEKRFKKLSNLTFEGILIHNKGIAIDANESLTKMLGYSREEIIGKNLIKLIIPQEYHTTIKKNINKNQAKPYEIIARKKDGTLFPIEVESRNIEEKEYRVTAIRDITKRKQAEKALKENEERYKTVFENTGAATCIIENDGMISLANTQFAHLAACNINKIQNKKTWMEFVLKDDLEKMSKQHKLRRKNRGKALNKYEFRFVDSQKNIKNIQLIIDVIPGTDKSVASLLDITERKQAEEELKIQKEFSDKIINTSSAIIVGLDKNHRIKLFNEGAEKITGHKSADVLGEDWFKIFFIPEMIDEMNKVWEDAWKVKAHSYINDIRIKNGDKRIIAWQSTRIDDEKNEKNHLIISIGKDITEQMKAEENNARLSRAIEQADETIVITDTEGTIQYVNPAFEKITGYAKKEAIGQNPRLLKSGKHNDAFYKKMWETLTSGKEWRGELINKKKDGSLYIENAIISPVFDSQGKIINYVAAKNDITETKRLQELESRAQRLETAGTIAGQVAHDFNNLLAPLMAYPEIIRDELPKNHSTLKYLDQIEQASHKIAEINQDLLTMGRRGHYNQNVLNLNTIIQNSLEELKPYSKTLAFEINLSDDLMDILGGGAQLHRMISNLLHNAIDAMQDIGQITIKTENYYVDDVSIVYGLVPKGEYVKLTISDTGCGISDDIVQKIFDPFFTSKTTDKKRGSGLGMSVVDAVIKDHNGYIDLSTKIGEGTSFYIYFPITRESMDNQVSGKICGGNETILIVDDDDMQREVSSQMLKKLGYKISTVKNGEKAVEFLRENPQNLVILDMVMPNGIDGTETYRQILEINSDQKAIILSGYSESDRVFEVQKLGAGAYVKKPITKKVIGAAVRTELDRPVKVSKS